MILVDKNIKELNHNLIVSGYNEENVNSMSYDLTIDCIYNENGKKNEIHDLEPGETVFVKTNEEIKMPDNLSGFISEKNSVLRTGLVVDGPTYQPGHQTFIFLRVRNISKDVFELSKGFKIAQIIFEELREVPNVPYNKQKNSSFNNEKQYLGLGNYKQEYENKTKKALKEEKEKIESMSEQIYANVLTIMGIIVAIFSMITINYQAFVNASISVEFILIMNLMLLLSIVALFGLIFIFINKSKSKCFARIYIAVLVVLAAVLVIYVFKCVPTLNTTVTK